VGRRAGGIRQDDQSLQGRVEADDLLSPFFPGGVHEDHRRHVSIWWAEVFGGPAAYTEQLGGYERMPRSTSVLASRTRNGSGSRH
jgi:hypothetical protein